MSRTFRFAITITDDNGDTIVSDWASFDPAHIDEFGALKAADMTLGSVMRKARYIVGQLDLEAEQDSAENRADARADYNYKTAAAMSV